MGRKTLDARRLIWINKIIIILSKLWESYFPTKVKTEAGIFSASVLTSTHPKRDTRKEKRRHKKLEARRRKIRNKHGGW